VLPVGESGRLVGMLTDPDITITIRAVAEGKAPDACQVREVMSPDIKYVFEDESLDDAARVMDKLQVRRLPVVSRDKRLVGIVSLSDVAIAEKDSAGEALKEVSEPPAERAQTLWMQISDAAW
jgi:CBS domain-containing protein